MLNRSEILIVLMTGAAETARWVKYEYDQFERIIAERRHGVIIPVCFPPSTPNDLVLPLSSFHAVVCPEREMDEPCFSQILGLVKGALR